MPRIARCDSCLRFAQEALQVLEGNEPWVWIEGPVLLPPWNLDDDLLAAYFDEDDEEEGLAPWKDPPLDLVQLSEAEVLELQNTYAAAVTIFDAQLGSLLDHLRARHLLDEMLFCVTARSGLPLGEHGMIGSPRPWLHDELAHVPLVMRLPGAASAGLRIAALTQPVDLAPTFHEALAPGIPPSAAMHGHSLWPLLRGEAEAVRPYAVSALRVDGRESRMLRTWDWVLHVPLAPAGAAASRGPQLFAKPEDRWEVNDLYQQQTEGAEQMERALRAFEAAIRQPGPLTYPPLM
jgi:arylsulfatase A-like enzyme